MTKQFAQIERNLERDRPLTMMKKTAAQAASERAPHGAERLAATGAETIVNELRVPEAKNSDPVEVNCSPRRVDDAALLEARIVCWMNDHPGPSVPGRCAWCGRVETPDAVLLPYGTEPATHTWLHSGCWPSWHAARRADALARVSSEPKERQPTPLAPLVPGPAVASASSSDEPNAARRGQVSEIDGRLEHFCVECGRLAPFGYGVRLRMGQLGRWYCAAHRPQRIAQ